MSWLIDLENEKKPKPKASSAPKKSKGVVTHVYPQRGSRTITIKQLMDMKIEEKAFWDKVLPGSALYNWLTRSKKDSLRRPAALRDIVTIANQLLDEEIKKFV